MKKFFETYVISFILCLIFLFFGSLFDSALVVIGLVALIIAILISAYIELETKIEELETRIKALESPKEYEDEITHEKFL